MIGGVRGVGKMGGIHATGSAEGPGVVERALAAGVLPLKHHRLGQVVGLSHSRVWQLLHRHNVELGAHLAPAHWGTVTVRPPDPGPAGAFQAVVPPGVGAREIEEAMGVTVQSVTHA